MKKYFVPVFFVLAAIGITSCSTKIKVDAPYKNITVIYGLLDMADTAHYIRIEKAFLDENKSALTMAQTPDSSFYSSLNVVMELVNSSGTVDYTYPLNRVDLNNEGYQKQGGTFFTSPNYAYKFKQPLDINYTYRIVVTNTKTGDIDSADAPVINEDPTVFNVPYFQDITNHLSFNTTQPFNNFVLAGTAPPNAQIFQVLFHFNYHEINTTTPTVVNYKSADWYQPISSLSQGNFNCTVPDAAFYTFLRDAIGAAPSPYVKRYMDSCSITVYVSTDVFYNYQNITQTTTAGLTANEVKPIYTNIKGKDVLGIFTSRGFLQGTFAIDSSTLDTLRYSPITAPLNIQNYR